jgi:hypothetical protein
VHSRENPIEGGEPQHGCVGVGVIALPRSFIINPPESYKREGRVHNLPQIGVLRPFHVRWRKAIR